MFLFLAIDARIVVVINPTLVNVVANIPVERRKRYRERI